MRGSNSRTYAASMADQMSKNEKHITTFDPSDEVRCTSCCFLRRDLLWACTVPRPDCQRVCSALGGHPFLLLDKH